MWWHSLNRNDCYEIYQIMKLINIPYLKCNHKFLGKFRTLPIIYTTQNYLYSSKPLRRNVLKHVIVNVKNLVWRYLYLWILLHYYIFLLISNIFRGDSMSLDTRVGRGTLSWTNFIKIITVSPLYPTVNQKYLKKITESS